MNVKPAAGLARCSWWDSSSIARLRIPSMRRTARRFVSASGRFPRQFFDTASIGSGLCALALQEGGESSQDWTFWLSFPSLENSLGIADRSQRHRGAICQYSEQPNSSLSFPSEIEIQMSTRQPIFVWLTLRPTPVNSLTYNFWGWQPLDLGKEAWRRFL